VSGLQAGWPWSCSSSPRTGKRSEAGMHHHLLSSWSSNGTILPPFHTLSWCAQEQLYLLPLPLKW